jgi:hypothetical protein
MRAPCEYRKLADGRFPEFRPRDVVKELDLDNDLVLDNDGDVRAYS